jgi:outer membrane murein-binding lipoprotein Lpp
MGLIREIAWAAYCAGAAAERRYRALVQTIEQEMKKMADAVNDLNAQVDGLKADIANDVSVESGALKLIQGFNSMLSQVETGAASIADVRAKLMASAAALSDAVAANTAAVAANTTAPIPAATTTTPVAPATPDAPPPGNDGSDTEAPKTDALSGT